MTKKEKTGSEAEKQKVCVLCKKPYTGDICQPCADSVRNHNLENMRNNPLPDGALYPRGFDRNRVEEIRKRLTGNDHQ